MCLEKRHDEIAARYDDGEGHKGSCVSRSASIGSRGQGTRRAASG